MCWAIAVALGGIPPTTLRQACWKATTMSRWESTSVPSRSHKMVVVVMFSSVEEYQQWLRAVVEHIYSLP
jgi:hypothetical protein